MKKRTFLYALPFVLGSLLLTGCGAPAEEETQTAASTVEHHDHEAHAEESKSTKPAEDDPRKVWPALYNLDDLAHEAEYLIEKDKWDELRGVLAQMVEPAEKLMGQLPEGIERTKEITFALGELESILKKINNLTADTDSQMVTAYAQSMKAITDKIMEAAKLPHVHADH